MPRSAPDEDDEATSGKVIQATVAFKPKLLVDYCAEIEEIQGEIDAVYRAADKKAQPKIDKIKEVKKKAAEDGFDKKVLNGHLEWRRHLLKAEKVANKFNEDQLDLFNKMCEANPWKQRALAQAAAAE